MVTKIMEWASITALLLVVSWRPVASHQIPLDSVVCAGSVMGVLALFFIKREIETHYDIDNRSNPADEASHCETAPVAVLSATENAVETLRRRKGRSETMIESNPNMQPRTSVAAEECTTVDAEEGPNARHNQDGHHPDQGWDILAGRAAIRK
jgi:hypothetical protein